MGAKIEEIGSRVEDEPYHIPRAWARINVCHQGGALHRAVCFPKFLTVSIIPRCEIDQTVGFRKFLWTAGVPIKIQIEYPQGAVFRFTGISQTGDDQFL